MARGSVDGDPASPSEPRVRQRFGHEEDQLLVMQVKEDAPYKARHGAIGGTWDVVAEKLNGHADFHMRPIKGTTAKARFDTLVARHRVWKEAASISGSEEPDSVYRQVMNELVAEIDARVKGAKEGEEDAVEATAEPRTRLGKRRASSDNAAAEAERREVATLHRPSMEQILNDAAESDRAPEVASPVAKEPARMQEQTPVVGDLVTVHQAMAELFKMQEAIALRPSDARIIELEKQNEARLREEGEKTKQRSLELQIEIERTKRRQLELEFEREERKKDREEQTKLIASLLQRLEPKKD
ncbi:hypothetical protein PRIC1_004502 [Phytophthora ramorum]|uniref:Myb-like domain-containing protein n=2 Tax=Phytophthora ramorum TaxID=164328 RepID=H3H9V1_PHYRM|nr:hypothetical protein KRP23_4261 [Phytophthora ramorum]KAH7507394.1 hypothetical protein KRP22_2496 [Phytophthora ramorum]